MDRSPQFSFQFTERRTWTVSGLLARLRQSLEREFFDVWIEGEISNFHRSAARHQYFTLKDGTGQLRAVIYSSQARFLRFELQDGLQVLLRGRVTLYEARGELQCTVEHVEPKGRGSLQLALEQLKEKLATEGLFDAARKRRLPLLPRRVGLITSPRGAVIADMIRVLRRRFANINVLLYPVQVQGEQAAGDIAQALAWFGRTRAADVLILARGGGSLEDLWPFNEERTARAIAASPLPVISAVGHETDFTIADFVADLRAPTPSAAAELVVRAKQDWLADCSAQRRRLEHALHFRLLRHRQALNRLTRHRAFDVVRSRWMARAQRLDEIGFRLQRGADRFLHRLRGRVDLAGSRVRSRDPRALLAMTLRGLDSTTGELLAAYQMRLVRQRAHLDQLRQTLQERNPLAILSRGYALVYDSEGRLVYTPSALNPGDRMQVQFATGWLRAEVRERLLQPFEPGASKRPAE